MRPLSTDLLRALALGLASGARSTAGPAAVAWSSRPSDRGPARWLGGTAGRSGTALALAGESAADKHPAMPSRLQAPVLAGRIAFGAAAAWAAAVRDRRAPALPALLGALGAAGGTYGGSAMRAELSRRLDGDLPGALLEDGLAVLLGTRGARRPSGPRGG